MTNIWTTELFDHCEKSTIPLLCSWRSQGLLYFSSSSCYWPFLPVVLCRSVKKRGQPRHLKLVRLSYLLNSSLTAFYKYQSWNVKCFLNKHLIRFATVCETVWTSAAGTANLKVLSFLLCSSGNINGEVQGPWRTPVSAQKLKAEKKKLH